MTKNKNCNDLTERKNYGTKKSFWRQFELIKNRNYSDLEILFELEFKGRKIK